MLKHVDARPDLALAQGYTQASLIIGTTFLGQNFDQVTLSSFRGVHSLRILSPILLDMLTKMDGQLMSVSEVQQHICEVMVTDLKLVDDYTKALPRPLMDEVLHALYVQMVHQVWPTLQADPIRIITATVRGCDLFRLEIGFYSRTPPRA